MAIDHDPTGRRVSFSALLFGALPSERRADAAATAAAATAAAATAAAATAAASSLHIIQRYSERTWAQRARNVGCTISARSGDRARHVQSTCTERGGNVRYVAGPWEVRIGHVPCTYRARSVYVPCTFRSRSIHGPSFEDGTVPKVISQAQKELREEHFPEKPFSGR